jgi:hypothetical protein
MKLPFRCLPTLAIALLSWGTASTLSAQCNDCGGGNQFGWKGATSSAAPSSGLFHSAAREHHYQMYQRNQAWPQPFTCWDRTDYLSIWQQMYTSGLAYECTLCDSHFDPGTGRLNRLGERKLQVAMQNNPEWQRGVLVAPTRDPQLSNQRLETVRESVRQWYGDGYAAQVAFSNIVPEPASGARIQAINVGYGAAMQPPTINQSGGSNSTTVGSTGSGSGGTGGGS